MKIKTIRCSSFFLLLLAFACQGPIYRSPEMTTAEGRAALDKKLRTETIGALKDTGPDTTDWSGAFWAMYAFEIRNDTTRAMLEKCIREYPRLSDGTKYEFWLALKVLYPENYKAEARKLLTAEENGKVYALGAQLLLDEPEFIMENIPEGESCQIECLKEQLAGEGTELFLPVHLEAFLQSPLFRGRRHIISFQPHNRNYPGLAVVVDEKGKPVRNEKGELLASPQLARAASNVPYYFTNGNSPCGLYAILGTANSLNAFIGPSPNIQMAMPWEVSPEVFFHGKETEGSWSLPLYEKHLPEGELPDHVLESFKAGRCGRTEIIAHGTTINPEYFRHQPFYPLTPSLGCFTARERYDPKSGRLQESAQIEMVEAFLGAKGENGYFLAVDVIDDDRPVRPEDVRAFFSGN
ncbi:MAG: hypothetical protein J5I94_03610 [Phaeodactylibacter sp.]|nr:hypothetical protein [Phaeodactylibacter sp.]